MKPYRSRENWVRPCVFFLLVLSSATFAFGQTAGRCYVAEIPGPIELPDRTVEEAGRLEICLTRMFSPVAGMHRTSIDGRTIGVFLSRRLPEEVPLEDDRPYFEFARTESGSYRLQGYSWSNGNERFTFDLRNPQVSDRWEVQRAAAEDEAPAAQRVIVLASLRGAR